ncbi:DMT family transporter [Pricia sp. S334]|uniref:DMT family transporter n=1 Tax=Pricia mediterranea TaxID=3076079 RepID=A0ABU3LA03_9FLAO|nr:DMT family transporter [Pricia sp. S334]MDT7830327.1 DMT family transporter [Pricia sp. S334]
MSRSSKFNTGNFLEINLAMLLMSTSGPFGKFITLPVPLTIAIRGSLALIFLLAYCKFKGISFGLEGPDRWPVFLSGLLMAVHWLTYFHALQLSNVAIGMLSLFTYPVMTAFLEPLFLKSRFQKIHLLLGVLVLFGIYYLVPDFNFGNQNTIAIGFGLLSALCYAIRNLILKTKVDRYQGSLLMTYQMFIVGLLLLPVFFAYDLNAIGQQWMGLLGVALITTVLGHTMFINCFKHFSVTTVSILSSVQPVYGILIGALFMSEIPGWSTVLGGTLILASVVVESARSYR